MPLYLESIIMRNFKSFRQSNISFGKGFNCVVGPNGSGKSNIFDSLLFVLGETSLRRMRAVNHIGAVSYVNLINLEAKPNPDTKLRSAYVKVVFGGDEHIEIERMVRSNGKTGYRMNGHAATRQQVVEVLRSHNCGVGDTNTITQGQIASIGDLNPKQRRELIDIAAGIKEFNDKKDSAMRELDKVEQKLSEASITLKERQGFLNELGKEKREAERYLETSERARQISYTILKNREKQALASYEGAIEAYAKQGDQQKELEKSAKALDETVRAKSLDREQLASKLNQRSVEVNASTKLIDEIRKNIAVKSSELTMNEDRIRESLARIESFRAEESSIRDKLKAINADTARGDRELTALRAKLAKYDTESEQGPESFTEQYEAARARALSLSTEIGELSQVLQEESNAVSNSKAQLAELLAQAESLRADLKENAALSGKVDSQSTALTVEIKGHLQRIKQLEEGARALRGSIQEIDENNINVREAIATMGGKDSHGPLLSRELAGDFHGKVHELFTYESKYALAVQASAMNRLNYLVVESAEAADRGIRILKTKGVGRATFIPLKDMVERDAGRKQLKAATPLLELVQYEPRFEKVFTFVFGNTYLVESIAAAKKIGFGSARFVTAEGDLVEQSGTITGGSMKAMQSPAVLQNRLKELDQRKRALLKDAAALEAEMGDKRTLIARAETTQIALGLEIKQLSLKASNLTSRLSELERRKRELETGIAHREQAHQKYAAKKVQLAAELERAKGEEATFYLKLTAALQGGKAKRLSKAEQERAKALTEEARQLDLAIAASKRELELSTQRQEGLGLSIKREGEELSRFRERKALATAEVAELEKAKAELEGKLRGNDKNTDRLYQEKSALEREIERLSLERGRLSSEMERRSRDQLALEMEKSQLQTRLSDLKAELMSFSGVAPLEESDTKRLEEQLADARAKITALGTVNQKAPEMFELKKGEVESASEKMLRLEGEKGAITGMIAEIDSKKLNIFMQTLERVGRNFSQLYPSVFTDNAELVLTDPKDPFNSGLHVKIKPAKGRSPGLGSFSGGQKSMTALILLLSIQMMNPMALYIFDEIDTALDKENSKMLSKLIKQLSSRSQFVVISHNDELIVSADIAIGVMKEGNASRAFGLRIREGKAELVAGA